MQRSSGVLMPMSSLPSPYGIGTMGKSAFEFVDFLKAAGQKYWQLLPLCPTSVGDSPYSSFSPFAGNPYFIDLDLLVKDRLLRPEEPRSIDWGKKKNAVDYSILAEKRLPLLRLAFERGQDRFAGELMQFKQEYRWVETYALYMALKAHFEMLPWTEWPDEDIRLHRPEAVRRWSEKLRGEMDFYIFIQFLFFRQWEALKTYAHKKGIRFIGDIPIFVAWDSVDVWATPSLFQLDENGNPVDVAGCPPDGFSADGQLWGNPLYRWTYLRFCRKYDWWVERMKGMSLLYDMIRIDHFIGFANYYSVKYGMPNARKGKWVIGPGKSLFRRLEQEVPDIRIIAEDLGCVNNRVIRLLHWCGYPGMKVLTFGFDSDESNPHFIGHYEKNSVAYTGTHDNDTTLGWAEKADPKALAFAEKTLEFSGTAEAPEAFIRALFKSPCDTVIIPMQDILGLDGSARMNYPGTIGGNWLWRMKPDQLSLELSMKYYRLNRQTERG